MKFSIITVVYNGEKTIKRTIESVLQQEYTDYEYLIIDGLSKDSTVSIASSYIEQFAGRLKIYSEKDHGIYDAMNKGIKKAKGQYVWLINADDYAEPDALMKIAQYYDSHPDKKESILCGGINLVDANSYNVIKKTYVDKNQIDNKVRKLKMPVSHPSTIVPNVVYERVGLYDSNYYISGDIDFILRCYYNYEDFVCPSIILSNMTDGGISNKFPIKKNLHDFAIRSRKFCSNPVKRMFFKMLYFIKIIILKYKQG